MDDRCHVHIFGVSGVVWCRFLDDISQTQVLVGDLMFVSADRLEHRFPFDVKLGRLHSATSVVAGPKFQHLCSLPRSEAGTYN